MLRDPERIVHHLLELQRQIRRAAMAVGGRDDLFGVGKDTPADFIYTLDTHVEPAIIEYCEHWAKQMPLVLVAEGLEPETGRAFPHGTPPEDAPIRVIVDPVDGTRGLMYDKRPAWSLAGVAPNRGQQTRLRHIELAAMTELPTTKMGRADIVWAIRGRGAVATREDLSTGTSAPLPLRPSQAAGLDHGFAMISHFFPDTKVLAGEAMEFICRNLVSCDNVSRGAVFDDQYICTGGQFYELAVGHDRFNADLRSYFYAERGGATGLCAHPYDLCTALVAEEAGVILTDGFGRPIDAPFDTTTPVSWAGYANRALQARIEPLLTQFLRERDLVGR